MLEWQPELNIVHDDYALVGAGVLHCRKNALIYGVESADTPSKIIRLIWRMPSKEVRGYPGSGSRKCCG